jgi:hypothetical protein
MDRVTETAVRSLALAIAIAIPLASFPASQSLAPRFHHLLVRVGAQDPSRMRDYYFGLFDAAGVRQETVDAAAGVASGDAHLLFVGQETSRTQPSAFWHFGWGSLVLNQAYAEHYVKEIEWKDPRVSLVDRFHLHLNSADPRAAAEWYATALGAEPTLGVAGSAAGSDDLSRRAEAFVQLGDVTLAFYRTSDHLVCSTGQRIDHLGVVADSARVFRAARISHLCDTIDAAREFRPTTIVEGPDGLIIEVMDR